VALIAVIGKDGADVAIKNNGCGWGWESARSQQH